MADILKDIASHSLEAISVAINSVLTDQVIKTQFEENLKLIADVLEKPPKKQKRAKRHIIPSDKKLFDEKVLPQIREAIAKCEEAEKNAEDLEWNINLSFVDKFANAELTDLSTIKATHAEIIKQEKTTTNVHLVITYHRGLLYLRARKFVKDDNIKDWYTREFGVVYSTVQRYILFAVLIQAYPRLLVCGLSFAQFSKHHNRILKHFETDRELADKLREHVTVSVQERSVDLTPADAHSIPKAKIPLITDPDYGYECDDWYDEDPEGRYVDDDELQDFFDWVLEKDKERDDYNIEILEESIYKLST